MRLNIGGDNFTLPIVRCWSAPSTSPFDWAGLAGYSERADAILAGGLAPENAARAAGFGTWALDVSSGVEAAPGRKDPVRLASFFRARRRLPGRGAATP